jgi:hypothetical protein
MQKWFSDRDFVAARDARRCSGFARTAIADSAIAARLAVAKPGASNAVPPATNGVRRVGSIIGIGNVRTANGTRRVRVTDQSSPPAHFSGTIRLWR